MNAMVAVCLKLLHQQLAVYEILRAAQGNNIYLIFLHFLIFKERVYEFCLVEELQIFHTFA